MLKETRKLFKYMCTYSTDRWHGGRGVIQCHLNLYKIILDQSGGFEAARMLDTVNHIVIDRANGEASSPQGKQDVALVKKLYAQAYTCSIKSYSDFVDNFAR
jgi:hypothetical protein